jgi:FkbM family methyltransferase
MKVDNLALNIASLISKFVPLSIIKYVYRSPKLSTLVRRSLNQIAPPGISQVSISAGVNEGLEMLLDLQTEKDYWLGTYEPELQQVVNSLATNGQVIYDIGANIGFVTLMLARKTGTKGHVYAFEALPENVNRLRKNVELNRYQDRVTVVHAAVQDHPGNVDFLIGPSGAMGKVQGSAGRESIEYQEKIKVEAISLDSFVEEPDNQLPDIIKIDIEGGEVLALPGMENLLHAKHPLVLMELHGLESAKISWHQLKKSGYRICRMEVDLPEVENLDELDWKSYLVAIPNE